MYFYVYDHSNLKVILWIVHIWENHVQFSTYIPEISGKIMYNTQVHSSNLTKS